MGEYKNNKKDGYGTFTFLSGEQFEGEFKDGKKHGNGKTTFPKGSKYEGEYKGIALVGYYLSL